MNKKNNPLLVAFITIFLDLLGFGILIPIQPFFAESLGASASTVTLLSAVYSVMQFLFAPLWGGLSDRYGRRPIILSSIFISSVGYFIFASAQSLVWLFVARAISGFGNANLGAAQAIIADSTSGADRAKGMGLIGAAFGLGFILGPAFGGFLGQISPRTPLYAAAFLAVFNLILAFFILPETVKKNPSSSQKPMGTLQSLAVAQRYDNVIPILLISLIAPTAFTQLEQIISLYIDRIWVSDSLVGDARIKVSAKKTALFLIVIGIFAAIIQGGLIGTLTKRFGEIKLILSGILILALSLFLIPWIGMTGHFTLLLCFAPFIAAGSSILNPSRTSLLSRSLPDDIQGSVLGIHQSAASLGRIIGPASAGFLFEIEREIPFYAGAILMILAAPVALYLTPPGTETESTGKGRIKESSSNTL